jgi:bifunctional non-homologous end joining protein LigD
MRITVADLTARAAEVSANLTPGAESRRLYECLLRTTFPQLAILVKTPPAGDGWLHEIKYDGYRIGCRIRNGRVALISRNGKDWTAAFPEIVTAAASLSTSNTLLDGEVAMVLPDGRTSFQALQNAFSGEGSRAPLVYFVFDLLRENDERLERLPLADRKERLRKLIGRRKTGRIRYSEHVVGSGDEFFEQACRLGLEGIISKRADQPYHAGRHADWVKTKCVQRQEFVIGGLGVATGAAPSTPLREKQPHTVAGVSDLTSRSHRLPRPARDEARGGALLRDHR